MTAKRLCALFCLLLCTLPASPQRVVVVCLREYSVEQLISQSALSQGVQALTMSRTASSPWLRTQTTPAQWERSAYLTLNAGTRAASPEVLHHDALQRYRQLVEANRRWGYPVVIGLLPEGLKKRGVRVRFLTADPHSAMLLAGAPFWEQDTRIAANDDTLWRLAERIIREHPRQMVWIDASGADGTQLWRQVLGLGRNLSFPPDAIYLIAPLPSARESAQEARMGWLMRLDGKPSGLLTSDSTRLPGYVTLPDITATWLRHFGDERLPPSVVGLPLREVLHQQPAEAVQRLRLSLVRQQQWNRTVGTLPTVQLVVLVIAWMLWRSFGRVVRAMWLLPCVIPVLGVSVVPVLICLPLGGISFLGRVAIWGACLATALMLLSRWSLRDSLRGLSIVLLIFIGVGALHGGELLRWSGYGYVLQEGARYYGIGNEMAGSLLGAQSGFLLTESTALVGARWLLTALLVGAPFWGANIGGMLSALIIAFVEALRSRRARRWILLAVPVLLVTVVAWELLYPHTTHLGTFLDYPQLWLVTLWRKLQMNLSLLLGSAWTPLLLFGIFGLKGAPIAVWAGALAMLLLNDSGVVGAAAMLVWWWAWRVSATE